MDSRDYWNWERCHGVWLLILSFEHVLIAIVTAYIMWLVFNRQAQEQSPNLPKSERCSCDCAKCPTEIPLCLK